MSIDPLLLDIPDTFESDRLILRCPRPGDGKALNDAILETLDDLRRFPASLPWARKAPAIADSEVYCRLSQANYLAREDFALLLLCKQTGNVVGASGLHRVQWSVPKCEIGYWCRRSYQGKGLVTEAVQAIASFAFAWLGAQRLEILTDNLNRASWRVCERTGFTLEGILRHERADPDGTLRDTRVYARLR